MVTLLELQRQIEKFIAENPEAADLPVGTTDYERCFTGKVKSVEITLDKTCPEDTLYNRVNKTEAETIVHIDLN